MDPKLLAILKKSKQVEAATNAKYGDRGAPNKTSGGGGLYDDIGSSDLITAEQAASMGHGGVVAETSVATRVDASNPHYEDMVTNSNLPPAVAQAMLKNPIPQPDMVGGVSEDDIKELNPNYGKEEIVEAYSDDDEYDFMTEQRHETKRAPRKPQQKQTRGGFGSGLSESDVKKMIAQEIARVLPTVVENYFDKKIIKENMKLMKYVIKNSQGGVKTKKRIS